MTRKLSRRAGLLGAVAAFGLMTAPVLAQTNEIKVGVVLSTTGPAAALGIPEKNSLDVVPTEIGGVPVKVIMLDDGGDPTAATTNARRLVTEDKVDILIGSSITPTALALANVAFENNVPHISLAPMPFQPGREKWTVVMPQPVPLMGNVLFEHMLAGKVKNVAMIGFSDSWGDLWLKEFKERGEPKGIKLVADERYARADTSVAGQALKIVAAKPDAVLVAASGTAAALPQMALRERGFTGPIYQTHGAVTQAFIRIAGKAAEGAVFASGPVIVAELQDDAALTKKPGVAYVSAYEAKFGKDSRTQFGAHMYDAFEVMKRVVPTAAKAAKPGTQEFREAIRQAFMAEKDIAASQGVYNFTEKDRYGVDNRARVLITVKNGAWALVK